MVFQPWTYRFTPHKNIYKDKNILWNVLNRSLIGSIFKLFSYEIAVFDSCYKIISEDAIIRCPNSNLQLLQTR